MLQQTAKILIVFFMTHTILLLINPETSFDLGMVIACCNVFLVSGLIRLPFPELVRDKLAWLQPQQVRIIVVATTVPAAREIIRGAAARGWTVGIA